MDEGFRHKGWHSRGYLPHLDAPGELQALTFRLADALPAKLVLRWKIELEHGCSDTEKREQHLHREENQQVVGGRRKVMGPPTIMTAISVTWIIWQTRGATSATIR